MVLICDLFCLVLWPILSCLVISPVLWSLLSLVLWSLLSCGLSCLICDLSCLVLWSFLSCGLSCLLSCCLSCQESVLSLVLSYDLLRCFVLSCRVLSSACWPCLFWIRPLSRRPPPPHPDKLQLWSCLVMISLVLSSTTSTAIVLTMPDIHMHLSIGFVPNLNQLHAWPHQH